MTSTPAPQPIWTPDPATTAVSEIERFRDYVNDRYRLGLDGYAALQRWSVAHLADLWQAVWDYYTVRASRPATTALADARMPGARWFPGARLNYVDQVLRHPASGSPALIEIGEDGRESTMSWHELRRQVGAAAATLRGLGVGEGDRVVGYLPNVAAAAVAFLATASLGAIWSVCAQDYAAKGASERLGQLEPAVLIAADGYRFRGQPRDRRDEVEALLARMPSVETVITVGHLGLPPLDTGPVRHLDWRDAIAGDAEPEPVQVDFDHPLWVLFTSGTTGAPKGIVHGHGGILLEHLVALGLHFDLGANDRFFWYTSPNWVMWNMLVGSLLLGATAITYDGDPTTPGPERLWQVVAEHGVTMFGTSPGYLLASQRAGVEPGRDHRPGSLRTIGSTGSTLPASAYYWIRDHVGADIRIDSVSGGTDVAGGFVGGAPSLPVWPGEISGAALGVALGAWDAAGKPLTGAVGELVVTEPIPSMPLYLWGDGDGERYRETYFATYPCAWRHGDWITITDRGSVLMHGRSDATLNRNGVRLGSADIYEAVESLPEIAEALVVGIEEDGGGYWLPLFVVLAPGAVLDDALRARIDAAIRADASPRHVPDEIIEVGLIPHTRTGKKLEVPVKRLLQGASVEAVLSLGAVDNTAAVDLFAGIAAARRERS